MPGIGLKLIEVLSQTLRKVQSRLFKSLRAAQTLSESRMFRAVLSEKVIQEFILNLNKLQLFSDNQDANGDDLTYTKNGITYTGYSAFTHNLMGGVKKNGVSFSIGDPYTISNSGDFYKSFNLELTPEYFKINANPLKEDTNLFKAFGKDIMGLQDKNLQKLIDVIRKKFIQEVRNKIAA
jgi:hypothetical protein